MIKKEFQIELLTTAQTLELRRSVLKPHRSEEESICPSDDLETTFHFGLVSVKEIACVVSFMQEPHQEISGKHPYRLRGMATADKFRGHGFGRELVSYGLEFLRTKHNCDVVWCDARESAFPFYEKLGFQFHGPMFDLKDTGPHKVMYKRLIPR